MRFDLAFLAVFRKDRESELRNRYSINSLLMFTLVTVSVLVFSTSNEDISSELCAGLFWVVIFFSSMAGLSRSFVSEEEKGTSLFLKLNASPWSVFAGKFIFNFLLVLSISAAVIILFLFFMGTSFIISEITVFIITVVLGNAGIAAASTIIAALISNANAKTTLYPILSFPILLPLILVLLELTSFTLKPDPFYDWIPGAGILISYDIIMLTASILLFDFIWKD